MQNVNEPRKVDGDLCHTLLTKKIQPKLSFNENNDYSTWKTQIKSKLIELLGIKNIQDNSCEPNFLIEKVEKKEKYTLTRFSFESEIGAVVPVYVLIPNTGKKSYPVAITMQGHSTGFHNSIGIKKFPRDEGYADGRGAFALQAVENGFAAVAIEQRYMGERRTSQPCQNCAFRAMTALQLGRTTLGERVWDISKTIDLLNNFPQLDLNDILITGNSGGGTISYYTACLDDRIKLSAPSCSFCSYESSILDIYHCPCNYIPNASLFFEMQDLACLIAPKKLIIIAGKEDDIFPIKGVEKGFDTIKRIYKSQGIENNCKLVETPKDHWWCEDIVWKAINDFR